MTTERERTTRCGVERLFVARLLTLKGEPLTWGEVDEQVARYWATHYLSGVLKVTPTPHAQSERCKRGLHAQCRGARRGGWVCDCICHDGGLSGVRAHEAGA